MNKLFQITQDISLKREQFSELKTLADNLFIDGITGLGVLAFLEKYEKIKADNEIPASILGPEADKQIREDLDNLTALCKPNYLAKDGSIKPSIVIDGQDCAPTNDLYQ